MKNPLMTRKKHEEVLKNRYQQHSKYLRVKARDHEREITKISKDLSEIVGNLSKIQIVYGFENTSRLVLDFDPRMVSMALERGNDDCYIDLIAEDMKRQIMIEIKTHNIHRPSDAGLGRRLYSVDELRTYQ